MKKFKPNLALGIGFILYAATIIVTRYWNIPDILHYALMLSAVALELWGGIILARSPEMKNSKLRSWKLRLIGKEPK